MLVENNKQLSVKIHKIDISLHRAVFFIQSAVESVQVCRQIIKYQIKYVKLVQFHSIGLFYARV